MSLKNDLFMERQLREVINRKKTYSSSENLSSTGADLDLTGRPLFLGVSVDLGMDSVSAIAPTGSEEYII